MTALGQHLAVMRDTVSCETGRHELTIVTDGIAFYAFGETTDVEAVVRETAHTYEGRCGQPLAGFRGEEGDPCEGSVVWDLSSDSTWTSDPEAISLLTRFARALERGDSLGDGE